MLPLKSRVYGNGLYYSEKTFNPFKQMCQGSVYALHNSRLDYIKAKMPEYEIIEVWEHEWDWACKNDETLKSFLKENEILDPINLRHALSGGRTNAIKLYYNCKSEEMIMYFDYTSLYPFFQKYGEFPDGHPRVITENFDENYQRVTFKSLCQQGRKIMLID